MNGTVSGTTTKPILLWSVPRSTSTAFERAFMQREDTKTLHEPFGEPYFFGPERLSKRYSPQKCAASEARNVSFSDIHKIIMETQSRADKNIVVVKDMAHYIIPPGPIHSSCKTNPCVLSDEDLKKYRHTFLIRTPKKTLESFYRVIASGDCGTDFGAFDPQDAGFWELRELLEYTRRLLPEEPVVVLDSADLIAEPERALRAFCSAVEIPFDPKMLSWEKRHISSFDKWKGWHDHAENSTGFKEIPQEKLRLPQNVLDAIEDNMPIYEYLREMKLKI